MILCKLHWSRGVQVNSAPLLPLIVTFKSNLHPFVCCKIYLFQLSSSLILNSLSHEVHITHLDALICLSRWEWAKPCRVHHGFEIKKTHKNIYNLKGLYLIIFAGLLSSKTHWKRATLKIWQLIAFMPANRRCQTRLDTLGRMHNMGNS